ncbi:hypothetical protein [Halosegnis longus]|uniref:hypothetical protein n=1 Tax=Halosegnis longus TaxID=2216012 RepID=UPI00129DD0AD|nr:hypothetical protein [Halosegnis longus]
MECDHCGEETPVRTGLTNVQFTGTISGLHSRYRVCPDCRDTLQTNPDVEADQFA